MSKQTAVQWLKDVTYPYLDKESKEYVDILFNHALQMEREQIIQAHDNKMIQDIENNIDVYFIKTGELYYKETYGGQDEN
jgi:hypothetical protein